MKNLSKLTAIAIFTLPLLFSDGAKAENEFDVCLRELTTNGVAIEPAQTGCADALNPQDLSYCVKTIAQSTTIEGTEALKNCYRVRRPIELGDCVASIQDRVLSTSTEANENSSVMMALNTCTASLLPDRHSQCVVALSRTPEVGNPLKAMETCISAEDFPRELYSTN